MTPAGAPSSCRKVGTFGVQNNERTTHTRTQSHINTRVPFRNVDVDVSVKIAQRAISLVRWMRAGKPLTPPPPLLFLLYFILFLFVVDMGWMTACANMSAAAIPTGPSVSQAAVFGEDVVEGTWGERLLKGARFFFFFSF